MSPPSDVPTSMARASQHRWHFFRSAGWDQVLLATADDLLHLDELDPKLWAALSCPTQGLELDPRTLAMIDQQGDGQISVAELRAAVAWACARLQDPATLLVGGPLRIDQIAQDDDPGRSLAAAAREVLQVLGDASGASLGVDDLQDVRRLFSESMPNGDGVVTELLAAQGQTPGLDHLVRVILEEQGGVPDRSGAQGVNRELAQALFDKVQAALDWQQGAQTEHRVLGDDTAAAWAALQAVAAKVEDFFTRQRVATFDIRSLEGLSPPVALYAQLGPGPLMDGQVELEALPLAPLGSGGGLPLVSGVNPAWASRLAAFRRQVVVPLLGARETLSEDDWAQVQQRLAPFGRWWQSRPATALSDEPASALGALADPALQQALLRLIDEDAQHQGLASVLEDLRRLVHYQRDLGALLRNFVNFSDFYDPQRKAIFQVGRLFLDRRCCELVLRVADPEAHARMAPFSACYLVYARCERAGAAPMNVVAALTAGEVDELMVPGRHGVLVDRAGQEWLATVTKVVEQPVSLRQAFFSPYRRVARFVEDQVRQFAQSKDKAVVDGAQAALKAAPINVPNALPVPAAAPAATTPAAKAATPAAPFDIARFAGIFAAIGLSLGALGTAVTAMVTGLLNLSWWQQPLALAAMVLVLSAPSMLLAWLKLRRRNLGPLLDANGWAVNARVPINLPFGASLTSLASFPAQARRDARDPFVQARNPWPGFLLAVMLVAALVAGLWHQGWLPLFWRH